MNLSEAAAALGKLGGSVKSDRKTVANRKNAKLPRKKHLGNETPVVQAAGNAQSQSK